MTPWLKIRNFYFKGLSKNNEIFAVKIINFAINLVKISVLLLVSYLRLNSTTMQTLSQKGLGTLKTCKA